jgi:hypothetical protein
MHSGIKKLKFNRMHYMLIKDKYITRSVIDENSERKGHRE